MLLLLGDGAALTCSPEGHNLPLMVSRVIIAVFATGSLLAAPLLCAAGLVTHPCDSREQRGCERGSDSDRGSGCGHESDCPADPCVNVVIATDRQRDNLTLVEHTCIFFAVLYQAGPCFSASATGIRLAQSPLVDQLPRPASDIPLLI